MFVASLIDSRMVLLQRNNAAGFNLNNIFWSPGRLRSSMSANNMLYALDKDSGITIFRNPLNMKDTLRYNNLVNFQILNIDKKYMSLSSFYDTVCVYTLQHGIPNREIFRRHINSTVATAFTVDNNLFICTTEWLERYRIDSSTVTFIEKRNDLGGILDFSSDSVRIVFASMKGITVVSLDRDNSFIIQMRIPLDYIPRDVMLSGNTVLTVERQRNRLLSLLDLDYPTNYQRLQMWETGLRIFRTHPIFGIGDIDVANTYAQFRRPYEKENFGHLHNNYIQFLVIFGLVGTCAVLFLLGKILRTQIQIFQSVATGTILSDAVLGAVGGTITFLVNGLGEWNFGSQITITMFWFLLGVSLAIRKYNNHFPTIPLKRKTV